VVDLGHGGGYGGAMKDYLERSPDVEHVLGVRTGNLGVKAQLCEALISDLENRRLRIEKGELTPHLRHELCYFESHREVVGGTPRVRYHGPQGDGEDDHDDCVISLALANWGRLHGWEGLQGETEDLSEYVKAAEEVFGTSLRRRRDDQPPWPQQGEVIDGIFFPRNSYLFPSPGSGYVF